MLYIKKMIRPTLNVKNVMINTNYLEKDTFQ
jgi:hypothetical protein